MKKEYNIIENLEILAEKCFNDKTIVKNIDLLKVYKNALTPEMAVDMALKDHNKNLMGLYARRTNMEDLRLTLQILSMFGNNSTLDNILNLMIKKNNIEKVNWKYFITLSFKLEFRKDSNKKKNIKYFYSRIEEFGKKLKEKEKLDYFWIFETGYNTDNPHVHFLISESKYIFGIKRYWTYGNLHIQNINNKYTDLLYLLKEYDNEKLELVSKIYPLKSYFNYNINNKSLETEKKLTKKKSL